MRINAEKCVGYAREDQNSPVNKQPDSQPDVFQLKPEFKQIAFELFLLLAYAKFRNLMRYYTSIRLQSADHTDLSLNG